MGNVTEEMTCCPCGSPVFAGRYFWHLLGGFIQVRSTKRFRSFLIFLMYLLNWQIPIKHVHSDILNTWIPDLGHVKEDDNPSRSFYFFCKKDVIVERVCLTSTSMTEF